MKIDANVIQFDKAKDTALKLRAQKKKDVAASKTETKQKEQPSYSNEIRFIDAEKSTTVKSHKEATAVLQDIQDEMKKAPESIKNVHRNLDPDMVLSLLNE
jgi:uncharacterized protein with WD repeat